MKQNTLSRMAVAIATLLVATTGCTNDTLSIDAPAPGDQGNGENRTTIQVSLPDGNGGSGAQTRTDYEDDPDPDKGVKVTWRTGDKLRVFGSNSNYVIASEIFTLKGEGGGVSGAFEGVAPKPEGGEVTNYAACYPSTVTLDARAGFILSMEGQMQSGDNSTTHLGDYDFLCHAPVADLSNIVFEDEDRETAMLRFDIDLSNSNYNASTDGAPYAIVLSSFDGNCFYKGFPSYLISNKTNFLILSLKDIDISTSKKFTAYMMAVPFDLFADFSVAVLCSNGQKYTATRDLSSNVSIEAGKRYTFTMKGTGLETWTKAECSKSNLFVDGQAASVSYSGGSGLSLSSPFLISSAADLAKLRNDVNNGIDYEHFYLKLTTDIRVVSTEWEPIGSMGSPFKGTFDGNGHTISGQLIGSQYYFGLFGCINGATISNLTMDATVTSTMSDVGAIVGTAVNSYLFGCVNKGAVTSPWSTGGIVGGCAQTGSRIVACINTGAIKGTDTTNGKIGGIVGNMSIGNNTVTACYSTGAVTGVKNVGSLAGYSDSNSNTLSNCCWVGASTLPIVGSGDASYSITLKDNKRYNTVATLNSTEGVDNLNAGITAWNTAHTSTPKLQCPYIFAAGTGEEPPILVVAAPK